MLIFLFCELFELVYNRGFGVKLFCRDYFENMMCIFLINLSMNQNGGDLYVHDRSKRNFGKKTSWAPFTNMDHFNPSMDEQLHPL